MEFLENTRNIRNICILAHVDHGKTTIADSLIASNGIISHRMAGKLRYMDSQAEEQERGITMKSSSIALKYEDSDSQEKFLVNLIDTPGHVDFGGEVSAAVRLCDGALIVLDVVEGVSAQTIAALENAWREGLEPIIVLNKIDRLTIDQKLDETAAYLRLEQLLEQANAVVATLLTTEIFTITEENRQRKDSYTVAENNPQEVQNVYDWASAIEDVDDDKYYFRPDRNNVIFACALDDWAFTIETMSKFLAKKHKINLSALQKTLWGDYYVNMKQQRILKGAQSKAKKNLFISMVLENIWKVYEKVMRKDVVGIQRACQILELDINQRDLNHSDSRHQLKAIMSKWLPLAPLVLKTVIDIVPNVHNLKPKRIDKFLSSRIRKIEHLPQQTQDLRKDFIRCSSDNDAIKISFISKMLPFEKKNLPKYRRKVPIKAPTREEVKNAEDNEDSSAEEEIADEIVFIAFARIFSGRLSKGDQLFVLGPKHDPFNFISNPDPIRSSHISEATIEDLFLLMGRDIESIEYANAGNIVGILGLEKHLVRTGTLSSSVYCPSFHDLLASTTPILRTAIEPVNPQLMPILTTGLKLLNQADPCVKVILQSTGEHVIVATGELHLEHCIRELKERYTNNIELNVSQPIVAFRETIVVPPKVDMVNEAISDKNTEMVSSKVSSGKKPIELLTPDKRCIVKLKASPIPSRVQEHLVENTNTLKILSKIVTSKTKNYDLFDDSIKSLIGDFKKDLETTFEESRKESNQWRNIYHKDIANRIWSFGPKHQGLNILVASPQLTIDYNIWKEMVGVKSTSKENSVEDLALYVDSFVSGFQLATHAGPLCEEPMHGVCFTIYDWSFVNESCNPEQQINTDDQSRCNYGPFSGQIISTVKEACRKAFQDQPQRLMSPMFSCDIRVTSEMLGRMYAVLGRRHGRIVHGDMLEGSQTFEIKAFIPVIESMDFVSEIRKQTSGLANPQLVFSHYEMIDVDPFWKPKTEEEYALYGEKADTENQAKKYMNLVRKRKGLQVDEKIVEHGEKQRTVKKNK